MSAFYPFEAVMCWIISSEAAFINVSRILQVMSSMSSAEISSSRIRREETGLVLKALCRPPDGGLLAGGWQSSRSPLIFSDLCAESCSCSCQRLRRVYSCSFFLLRPELTDAQLHQASASLLELCRESSGESTCSGTLAQSGRFVGCQMFDNCTSTF